MKTRTGFVSNSSSSSFIIGFDKRPKSVKELQKIMFGDLTPDTQATYYDYSMSIYDIAKTVFDDLKGKRPVSITAIKKNIREGHFEGAPLYHNMTDESDHLEAIFYKKYPNMSLYEKNKITDPEALKMANTFEDIRNVEYEMERKAWDDAAEKYYSEIVEPKFKGKMVYILEYADDGGQALMEHGDVFHSIPHIRISHH